MADFSEPPSEGPPPFANGHDIHDGRMAASLIRLDERTNALNRTVSNLQDEIKHLPTKTTLGIVVSAFLAVLALVAAAYWNGISGKFEGVSGKFDAVNAKMDGIDSKLDGLARAEDRLNAQQQPTPAPVFPSRHR